MFKHVQLHVCVQGCMYVYLNMSVFVFRDQTLVSFLRQFIAHFCVFETGCLAGLELTKTDQADWPGILPQCWD